MIALVLALLAQDATPVVTQRTPSLRECAVNFVSIGLLLDEQRKKDRDAKMVRRVRDALVIRAGGEAGVAEGDATFAEALRAEAAARLASAKAATDRGQDTEIDYATCFALSGVR